MSGGAESSSLSSSLTDMMTSLMVIFVLLLVTYLQKEQGAASKAQGDTSKISSALRSAFDLDSLLKKVKIEEADRYTLKIIIPEELLFKTGRANLEEVGNAKEFLDHFTPVFLNTLREPMKSSISSIVVEGHTDHTQRLGDEYQLELSQERSRAVMEYMLNRAGDDKNLFLQTATAGGRGPIDCDYQGTDEQRKRNCRTVKFKVRIKTSEERRFAEAVGGPSVAIGEQKE